MTNNNVPSDVNQEDDPKTLLAQNRLLKLYSKLKRKGGWRAVADRLGIKNVSYVHRFALHGELPNNPEIRQALLRGRAVQERKPEDMDEMMQRLQYVMSTWHVGKEKAIKKRDLLTEIFGEGAGKNESYNNPYDRKLRSMIEELNHDHGGLICSTPDAGYFWASSLTEGLDAVEASNRRAVTQLDNAKHLERNLKNQFGGQLELLN
jgi:hypothetical protein